MSDIGWESLKMLVGLSSPLLSVGERRGNGHFVAVSELLAFGHRTIAIIAYLHSLSESAAQQRPFIDLWICGRGSAGLATRSKTSTVSESSRQSVSGYQRFIFASLRATNAFSENELIQCENEEQRHRRPNNGDAEKLKSRRAHGGHTGCAV